MATKKKMLQAAAGQAGGAGLDITDVFSTYLYDGNGSTQTITNGIDLDGEGGMTWIKLRNSASNNELYDTERGATNSLSSNITNGTIVRSTGLTAFNSDGFTLGAATNVNANNYNIASWTFRKAPKFFDIVTYTGNNTAGKTVSHNLGSVPGMIIVKRTDNPDNWYVYHRGLNVNGDNAPETDYIRLNLTSEAFDSVVAWNDTAPTSTEFTLGDNDIVNATGGTYVAYLFAHNNGDGEFGPDADQDIIKCGSYTGNGAAVGPEIDLGFEPQWLLVKRSSGTEDWMLFDSMRTIPTGSNTPNLRANTSAAEYENINFVDLQSTGFNPKTSYAHVNQSGDTYIYMAIRRGPLAQPESATEVFAIDIADGTGSDNPPQFVSGFPVDAAIIHNRAGGSSYYPTWRDRLRGTKGSYTFSTVAETSDGSQTWDFMNGHFNATFESAYLSWMWKRAPGFFDVVAYSGDSTTGRTVSHNLGVAPDLFIVKRRTGGGASWTTYVSALGATKYLRLNNANAAATSSSFWNNTSPTDSVFTLGGDADVNGSGEDYIAYFFATLPGVSKVGSFTHTSSTTQNIDCGFSSGARFVLVKQYASTGNWFVYDTARGIVAGNDPRLSLNTTQTENTGNDDIDPYSAGFTLTTNFSGGSYIFYAIA